jgi:hypothetical protein
MYRQAKVYSYYGIRHVYMKSRQEVSRDPYRYNDTP